MSASTRTTGGKAKARRPATMRIRSAGVSLDLSVRGEAASRILDRLADVMSKTRILDRLTDVMSKTAAGTAGVVGEATRSDSPPAKFSIVDAMISVLAEPNLSPSSEELDRLIEIVQRERARRQEAS